MIVCLCKAVSDKTIRAAIENGAGSVEAVGAACGAGTGCGSCVPDIEHMLAKADRLVAPAELVRHCARRYDKAA
jgi:bacterioferritin-associated ferredoxin